jgi:hypothetical protein
MSTVGEDRLDDENVEYNHRKKTCDEKSGSDQRNLHAEGD